MTDCHTCHTGDAENNWHCSSGEPLCREIASGPVQCCSTGFRDVAPPKDSHRNCDELDKTSMESPKVEVDHSLEHVLVDPLVASPLKN